MIGSLTLWLTGEGGGEERGKEGVLGVKINEELGPF
jgi:hypothetical protein